MKSYLGFHVNVSTFFSEEKLPVYDIHIESKDIFISYIKTA